MRRAFFLLLAFLCMPCVMAQTFPVDDSGSQVLTSGPVKMQWDSLLPSSGRASTMTGQVVVLVKLDTSPWRGQRVRLYQRLASIPNGPVNVTWATNGSLLPGRVHDGERALVYAGLIDADLLEDTLTLTIQADGDRILRVQDLRFSFEIDPELP